MLSISKWIKKFNESKQLKVVTIMLIIVSIVVVTVEQILKKEVTLWTAFTNFLTGQYNFSTILTFILIVFLELIVTLVPTLWAITIVRSLRKKNDIVGFAKLTGIIVFFAFITMFGYLGLEAFKSEDYSDWYYYFSLLRMVLPTVCLGFWDDAFVSFGETKKETNIQEVNSKTIESNLKVNPSINEAHNLKADFVNHIFEINLRLNKKEQNEMYEILKKNASQYKENVTAKALNKGNRTKGSRKKK